jgi:hypothetical protein
VHVDLAHNIPLAHLDDRFGEIPADRPVAVVGGYKAWLAAKLPA